MNNKGDFNPLWIFTTVILVLFGAAYFNRAGSIEWATFDERLVDYGAYQIGDFVMPSVDTSENWCSSLRATEYNTIVFVPVDLNGKNPTYSFLDCNGSAGFHIEKTAGASIRFKMQFVKSGATVEDILPPEQVNDDAEVIVIGAEQNILQKIWAWVVSLFFR